MYVNDEHRFLYCELPKVSHTTPDYVYLKFFVFLFALFQQLRWVGIWLYPTCSTAVHKEHSHESIWLVGNLAPRVDHLHQGARCTGAG